MCDGVVGNLQRVEDSRVGEPGMRYELRALASRQAACSTTARCRVPKSRSRHRWAQLEGTAGDHSRGGRGTPRNPSGTGRPEARNLRYGWRVQPHVVAYVSCCRAQLGALYVNMGSGCRCIRGALPNCSHPLAVTTSTHPPAPTAAQLHARTCTSGSDKHGGRGRAAAGLHSVCHGPHGVIGTAGDRIVVLHRQEVGGVGQSEGVEAGRAYADACMAAQWREHLKGQLITQCSHNS